MIPSNNDLCIFTYGDILPQISLFFYDGGKNRWGSLHLPDHTHSYTIIGSESLKEMLSTDPDSGTMSMGVVASALFERVIKWY